MPGLRVVIMTDEKGWHTRQLQAALRARGAVGHCVDLADCYVDTTASWHGLVIPGFSRGLPDAALVRGIAGGSFEQVTKRLGVLHALRELGVPVYNDARAIERSVDKSMTSLLLHAAGVPTPPTWATESAAHAQRIAIREGALGHALVLKPLFGSQGKGLQLVGHVGGVHHPLPALDKAYGALAYLQRFLPAASEPGFDWRVLVVGGRAITAMRRVSTHWVHNIAQGARSEPAELTRPLAELAERAALALDMDYAGVDLLPSATGPAIQVIEVNGVAAWQGLQRVTSFNIARAIVDDLLDRKLALARSASEPGAGKRA
ncbi:MAG: RimK family alpha-L-glutamate ligase [Vitreoscilla sp.]|nr:RimK family alpha-L-glutamate ligase [Vitreoscilla sp.]